MKKALLLILLATAAPAPAVASDGAIVFQRADGLYVVRPDGSGEAKLPFGGEQPRFSPDGRTIAFVKDGDVWIVPANASGPPARVTSGGLDADPVWSPGGQLLAFDRTDGGRTGGVARGIWIHDLGTGAEKRLSTARGCGQECVSPTGLAVIDSQPTWSPNGDEIAFVRRLWTGGTAILITGVGDEDGERPVPREIAPILRSVSDPHWSPDGSRIAFVEEVRGTSGRRRAIGTIGADGGPRIIAEPERCHPIVDGRLCEVDYGNPAWSPDGDLLVLTSNRDATEAEAGNDALYVMGVDASGIARLTAHTFAQSRPDWGPLTIESLARPPVCMDAVATVSGETSTALALLCSDANADPLERSIVTGPAHGTLAAVDQGAGAVRYAPAPGFRGADSLTFHASDGTAASNLATVTITVVDPPPPPPPGNPGGSSHSGGGSSSDDGGFQPPVGGSCNPTRSTCTVIVGTCPPVCDGDMSNTSPGASAAALRHRLRPLFRRARFSARRGGRAVVRLRLTPRGRRLLRRHHTVRTGYAIRFRTGHGPYKRRTGTLTLRRRGHRR